MMMSDAIEDGRQIGQVAYYGGIGWHTQHWRRTAEEVSRACEGVRMA